VDYYAPPGGGIAAADVDPCRPEPLAFLAMNKRKRVAWAKHRKRRKKLEERKKAARTPAPSGRGAAAAAASAAGG